MKENFDDILKRKWEEKQFPMDEKHRSEMIELLNDKNRRGIFPFWWLGGLIVATVVVGFFFLTNKDEGRMDLPKQEKTGEEKPTAKDELASGSTQQNQVLQESNTTDKQPTTTMEQSVNAGSSSSGLNTPTSSSDVLSSNKSYTSKTSSALQNKTSSAVYPNVRSDEQSGKSLQQIDPAANGYFLVDDEAMRSVTMTTQPVAVIIKSAELNAEPELAATNFPEKRTNHATQYIDPLLVEGIHYTSNDVPGLIKAQTSFKKSLYLFGETGVGMIFASKPDYTSGWKFRAGAGLGFKLSPKVQLAWSLGYLMQDGGFDFERTSTVNQSGFGTRSSFNTLTPERLYFIYTRFGLQYRMHRHLLGVHGGIQYLYGAQGTIVIQSKDQFFPDMLETSTNTWLNTNGLRKLNWTADVSYGYQLTPRLSAMAGTDIYFSSITIPDAALTQEGYYWNGAIAALHPFVTLNYLIYGR